MAAVLAVAGLVVFATDASAHDNSVTASTPTCSTSPSHPGDILITWTIANDYPLSETGTVTSLTGGVSTLSNYNPVTGYSIGANGSIQLVQYLPASDAGQTITMDISSTWSDQYSRTDSGSIDIPHGLNCKPTPQLTTSANPSSGAVGSGALADSATLSGGSNPTGTITFYLFNPNQSCSATPAVGQFAFTQVVTVSGNGSYGPTTGGPTPNLVGTWHWLAVYSGDANNAATDSGCSTEPVTIGQQSPALETTAAPMTTAVGAAALTDSATLSGGYNPTGTITFYLFNPTQTCSAAPDSGTYAFTTSVDVTKGNETYGPMTGPLSSMKGTWEWIAVYSGDSNNKGTDSGCGNEPVTVTPAHSTTTTQQSGATEGPGTIVLGQSVTDTTTVQGNSSGGAPTGSVLFYECGPGSSPMLCTTAHQVGTGPAGLTPVSQTDTSTATSDSFTPNAVGGYCFAALYMPDGTSNYSSSSDNLLDQSETPSVNECFTVTAADPQLGTQQSGSTSGSGTLTLGGSVTDTATVTGNSVSGVPTGTVTFTVCSTGSSPAVCPKGTSVGSAVTLSGSGHVATATSASYKPTAAGTYCFAAVYTPDASSNYASANDNMSGTVQSSECVVVTAIVTTPPTTPTTTPTTTPAATAAATATTVPPNTSPAIAFTGAPLWQEWLIGLGALVLGSGLLVLARRRRRPEKGSEV